MAASHLSGPLYVGGVMVAPGALIPTTGRYIFVAPGNYPDSSGTLQGGAARGHDGDAGTADAPVATLAQGYSMARSGYGDVVVVVAVDGGSGGSARTATLGITWAKANTHLQGICAPGATSQRARIAPPTASTTCVTTLTVSGSGCQFKDLQIWNGHAGDIDQFNCKVTGQRNTFTNVHFAGIGHATPAARAGSRAVTIAGGAGTYLGENRFIDCTFGNTTVQRSAANALLEFLTFTSGNVFEGCRFLSVGSDGTALWVYAGASTIQDYVLFNNCVFGCLVKQSGATAMVHGFGIDANAGGDVWLHLCGAFGLSGTLVDASNSNVYTDLPASAAAGSKATLITHA